MNTSVTASRYLPGTYAQKRPDAAQRAQHYVRQWEQKKAQRQPLRRQAGLAAPVICLSRKIGVGALEIADILARKTGHRVADRIIIEKIATDAELGARTVAFFDERHPGQINEIAAFLFGEKSFVMSDYMRKLIGVVFSLAESEATIFVGRGTHLLLPREQVLAVRCIGSRSYRVKRVADILEGSEAEAQKELDAADKEQQRFFKKAFGKKDAPPDEFDLVVNCDYLDRPEWVAGIIHQAFRRKFATD